MVKNQTPFDLLKDGWEIKYKLFSIYFISKKYPELHCKLSFYKTDYCTIDLFRNKIFITTFKTVKQLKLWIEKNY